MLLSMQVLGQSGVLSGTVTDELGLPLAGVSIHIDQISSPQLTDSAGNFSFSGISSGRHTIHATYIGYAPYATVISLQHTNGRVEIRLTRESRLLDDVTVTGKSETQQVREQAIRAVVVDTRAVAEQPVTLAELMNRSPGIRIRQSGGLGNAVDMSINGFQGNSVQYFRDGIPLEYLGGGYGINNVPINLLERVEVYKGVIPVSLGGDALGGAVNLVTKRPIGKQLHASYELASFNTHIGNASYYQTDSKNQLFFGVDAFYNYSDNDYKATVEVTDQLTSNPVPVTVRLFHNGYKHHFGEAYLGFKNKPWTDELKLSVAVYGIERESQHPALMTNPYGAVSLRNRGIVPSLRYKKSLLGQRLSLDQFVSYGVITRNRTDTVRGTYDWYGNFTPRTTSGIGESPNASLSDIDFSNLVSRTHMVYQLNVNHRFEANLVFNHSGRKGSDPLGFRFQGTDIDVLSREARYQKTIAGVMWESKWLDKKLTNQLSAKYFSFKSEGINAFLSNDTDLSKYTSATDDNWGIGNAVKYQINTKSFIRASVELTNRLPLGEELFGNNDTRAPNFNLQPERSFNANLGYRYANQKLATEVGAFYRKTQGMIMLVPIQPPFAQYRNLDSIKGYGFDIDLVYRPQKSLTLNANMTWQDNRMVDVGAPLYRWTEGTRQTNTPYFFANASATASFIHVFKKNDALKPYIHYNFIREFYLVPVPRDKEPRGFLGLFGESQVPMPDLVPNQSLVSIGLNYVFPSTKLIFGAEVKNLVNTDLYDYYKVQRPGRSFHLKINYYITSTH